MGYYPTKQELQLFQSENQKELKQQYSLLQEMPIQFARGTSQQYGMDAEFREMMRDMEKRYKNTGEEKFYHLSSRMKSVASLDDELYEEFCDNKNSLYNWFPKLKQAIDQQDFFKVPKTKVERLPVELAQFIRLDYQDTTLESREIFNQIIFKLLELEEDKTYFIKTGTFSSKFQYHNARCTEPLEMGEYFQVINNFAMEVGAGMSVDVVAREYIEDVEGNPTIYNGMPLRTEYRTFVDFDTNEVIGTAPYWHPVLLENHLKRMSDEQMRRDYLTYLSQEEKLNYEYNRYVTKLQKEISKLIENIDLEGQYSIDIMKNGEDFYIIDMALMSDSALTEFINTEGFVK
ncbi:hypothetical protein [Staphylococcus haemolyticus]|uniref:hypothetical protein n=1 Tax=Staphylococcus haemolyticus TaxID=1283 RepID=UPI001F0AC732|nr:hypothetical protein [Staphylococcus haemolyticus]MCH4501189.1 hypothetical protein [Staphylococcus haemolyticus]